MLGFGGDRVAVYLAAAILLFTSGCRSHEDLVELSPIRDTGAAMVLEPVRFEDLPGWSKSDLRTTLEAFRRSCAFFMRGEGTKELSSSLPYAGRYEDWKPACKGVAQSRRNKGSARSFFEDNFVAFRVSTEDGVSKLTAYYEPEILASREPGEGLVAIPGVPSDLAFLDLSDFDPELEESRHVVQLRNNQVHPYPARADIVDDADKALGFADSMDVYYLQIQGSGRVVFSKGEAIRAVFAAHNDRPFKSIASHLIEMGQIEKSQASMRGIKSWAEQTNPELVKMAMNVNPRYVWFKARPLEDFYVGPAGAQGVPLTPMGSMAVDPEFYPYGVPIYVDSKRPSRPGDWQGQEWRHLLIAQDTGGAIKGGIRGDVFFGSGAEAGGLAGNMNHPGQFWVLLPKRLVLRFKTS